MSDELIKEDILLRHKGVMRALNKLEPTKRAEILDLLADRIIINNMEACAIRREILKNG